MITTVAFGSVFLSSRVSINQSNFIVIPRVTYDPSATIALLLPNSANVRLCLTCASPPHTLSLFLIFSILREIAAAKSHRFTAIFLLFSRSDFSLPLLSILRNFDRSMSDPDSPMNHDPIPDPDPDPNQSPLQIQSSPPLALLPPPSTSVTDLPTASVPATSKTSRRLPPPCWSLEETTALIDAYREKWLSLNRGNLKANHWEEVAESVAANCPEASPKKTAVQCRHKMEKLRKKYRTEIQRARSVPVARFISSWVHFKRMESMEIRTETIPSKESEDEDGNYAARFTQFSGGGSAARTTPRFFNRNGTAGSGGGSGGIRIRIPTGVSIAQPGPRFPGKIDPKYTVNPNSGIGTTKPSRVGAGSNYGKRGREMMMTTEEEEEEEDDDPMVAIASAIKLLGDTMLRTEQTKMEMSREIEAMRMDMEMKRTKMILESQQRIVEAFAKSLSENTEEKKKKARRVSSLATDS